MYNQYHYNYYDIADEIVVMIAQGIKHLRELKSIGLCDNSILREAV